MLGLGLAVGRISSKLQTLPAIITGNLVSFYDFKQDITNPQVLLDKGPNKLHGRLGTTAGVDSADPTWASNGLYFSGGKVVVVDNYLPDEGAESYTFIAPEPSSSTSLMTICLKGVQMAAVGYTWFYFDLSRKSVYFQYANGTNSAAVEFPIGASLDTRPVMTFVVNYNNATLALYVNGQLLKAVTMTTPLMCLSTKMCLGSYMPSATTLLHPLVGTLRLFMHNRVEFTPEQITLLHDYVRSNYTP